MAILDEIRIGKVVKKMCIERQVQNKGKKWFEEKMIKLSKPGVSDL